MKAVVVFVISAVTFGATYLPKHHHVLPESVEKALAGNPDTVVVYVDPEGRRGNYRMALSGDAGEVLVNCALGTAGSQFVVSGCELASGASIEDVLTVLARPARDAGQQTQELPDQEQQHPALPEMREQ
jgi:hypothetical protein